MSTYAHRIYEYKSLVDNSYKLITLENQPLIYCTQGLSRDIFDNDFYEIPYTERGIPQDISRDTRELLEKYKIFEYNGLGKTYFNFEDVNNFKELIKIQLENHIKTECENSMFKMINKKLDYLIDKNNAIPKSIKKNEYYEEKLDDLFNIYSILNYDIQNFQLLEDILNYTLDNKLIEYDSIRCIFWIQ